MVSNEKLTAFIKQEALRLGFSTCAFTAPGRQGDIASNLKAFVDAGYHGSMEWMTETLERRSAPLELWPDCKSIIMLAMNYGPDGDPLAATNAKECGAISVYARNRDYHDVIKGKLKELGGKIASRAGCDIKVFVDTAPVMEKPIAMSAGLGWQGKHTNLVSRDLGSWFFLGSIFTTAELPPDAPEPDHCGSCRACLDACPTGAFPAPHQIDARRCISYLTIEHKGPIDRELRPLIGNRIYGCDDCLAACPWNKFAVSAQDIKLQAREDLLKPRLDFLLGLDDAAFRQFFSGSPIKRIGRNRFIRNCLIAAGNSEMPALLDICIGLCRDDDPVARAMALWAVARLGGASRVQECLVAGESDPVVFAEFDSLEHEP